VATGLTRSSCLQANSSRVLTGSRLITGRDTDMTLDSTVWAAYCEQEHQFRVEPPQRSRTKTGDPATRTRWVASDRSDRNATRRLRQSAMLTLTTLEEFFEFS